MRLEPKKARIDELQSAKNHIKFVSGFCSGHMEEDYFFYYDLFRDMPIRIQKFKVKDNYNSNNLLEIYELCKRLEELL